MPPLPLAHLGGGLPLESAEWPALGLGHRPRTLLQEQLPAPVLHGQVREVLRHRRLVRQGVREEREEQEIQSYSNQESARPSCYSNRHYRQTGC